MYKQENLDPVCCFCLFKTFEAFLIFSEIIRVYEKIVARYDIKLQ